MPALTEQQTMTFLEAEGIKDAYEFFVNRDNAEYEEKTIRNIVYRLHKYGSLSPKQINYVKVLINKINKRVETLTKRLEEKAKAEPCPRGRVTIVGEVLSIKEKHYNYGTVNVTVPKMFVKTDQGYTVWGSVPTYLRDDESIEGVKKLCVGDRVEFTATLNPANDDPKHGFFKRPNNATILEK